LVGWECKNQAVAGFRKAGIFTLQKPLKHEKVVFHFNNAALTRPSNVGTKSDSNPQ
jgi:hypothetical protein